MKALILLSHGSRREESTQEMMALAQAVADAQNQSFATVACAFQQFASPTFDETVDRLVAEGATHLVVFPLFLAAGSHVQEDVPEMVAVARQRHRGITLTLTPHLGKISDLAGFLLAQAVRHA